jgi:hypothetical protein
MHAGHIQGISGSRDGYLGGRLVLFSDMSFPNACPRHDPLIAGVDRFRQIRVGDHAIWHKLPPSDDIPVPFHGYVPYKIRHRIKVPNFIISQGILAAVQPAGFDGAKRLL